MVEYPIVYCPKCGAKAIPTITVNNKNPLTKADKVMEKYGIFFPHIDVDYTCEKDGHLLHLTYEKGLVTGASGCQVLMDALFPEKKA